MQLAKYQLNTRRVIWVPVGRDAVIKETEKILMLAGLSIRLQVVRHMKLVGRIPSSKITSMKKLGGSDGMPSQKILKC